MSVKLSCLYFGLPSRPRSYRTRRGVGLCRPTWDELTPRGFKLIFRKGRFAMLTSLNRTSKAVWFAGFSPVTERVIYAMKIGPFFKRPTVIVFDRREFNFLKRTNMYLIP